MLMMRKWWYEKRVLRKMVQDHFAWSGEQSVSQWHLIPKVQKWIRSATTEGIWIRAWVTGKNLKKNLIRHKHAEKLGEGGRVCLGNLLITGRKTLISRQAKQSKSKGGGGMADRGITLEGFKQKEKVVSRVRTVSVGTSSFAKWASR